jgi:hypothetical protein
MGDPFSRMQNPARRAERYRQVAAEYSECAKDASSPFLRTHLPPCRGVPVAGGGRIEGLGTRGRVYRRAHRDVAVDGAAAKLRAGRSSSVSPNAVAPASGRGAASLRPLRLMRRPGIRLNRSSTQRIRPTSVSPLQGRWTKETRTNNCFDFLPGNREQSRGERQQAIQLFLRVS